MARLGVFKNDRDIGMSPDYMAGPKPIPMAPPSHRKIVVEIELHAMVPITTSNHELQGIVNNAVNMQLIHMEDSVGNAIEALGGEVTECDGGGAVIDLN